VHCGCPSASRVSASYERQHPFSRSYGADLPSSLTRVLSRALVFSTRLPVLVCGTVPPDTPRIGFSWPLPPPVRFAQRAPLLYPAARLLAPRGGPWSTIPRGGDGQVTSPPAQRVRGVLDCLPDQPSPPACACGLGPTNQQRTSLPAETLGFRRAGFSPAFSLLIPAFSLLSAPPGVAPSASPLNRTLPYQARR